MNKKYKTLFALIARTLETTAEQAMEIDKQKGDMQAYKTAKEMRSKYARLHDLLTSKTVNYVLVKADYIDLFIGANLVVQQIQNRIKKEQQVLKGYEILIPQLQKIVTSPEEEIEELSKEFFTILEEPKN